MNGWNRESDEVHMWDIREEWHAILVATHLLLWLNSGRNRAP